MTGNGVAISKAKKLEMSDNGWYVIYVKPKHEKSVDRNLQEKGIESFLPLTTKVRQWSDRIKKIKAPLFPGYVFVNINSKIEFYQALQINGVSRYLRFGNEYSMVSNKEITQIKCLLGLSTFTEVTAQSTPKSIVGEIKKITYGPMMGLECEILEVKNAHKVIVRIDALSQSIIATLPLGLIAS